MEYFYLIVILWVIFGLIGGNKKQRGKTPSTQRQAQQPHVSAAVSAKKPEKPAGKLTQEQLKKVVSVLFADEAAGKAPSVKAAPAQPQTPATEEPAFYQGTSFGDEGVDPCHDDLYEARLSDADESVAQAAPAIAVSFTADRVLNGVIMSEVLNRRAD